LGRFSHLPLRLRFETKDGKLDEIVKIVRLEGEEIELEKYTKKNRCTYTNMFRGVNELWVMPFPLNNHVKLVSPTHFLRVVLFLLVVLGG
jgi:hypothetical protein